MKRKSISYLLVVLAVIFLIPCYLFADQQRPKHFGREIGDGNGVKVYDNGSTGWVDKECSIYNKKYMGIKWQCVEFARRYTYIKRGYLIPSNSLTYSAKSMWKNAAKLGLKTEKNGGGNRPRTNDLVFSTYGDYGHVGVITSAPGSIKKPGNYTITITHQNWSTQNNKQSHKTLTLTVKKGKKVWNIL